MITRITGTLRHLRAQTAYLEVGPVWYEVLLPTMVADRLPRPGAQLALFTFAYIEGGQMGSTMQNRVIGFLDLVEREFFELLITVGGLGMKKAARAMAVPVSQIAAAIERGDERTLKSLPEIGPKTAKKIIAELQGKMGKFALLRELPVPTAPASPADDHDPATPGPPSPGISAADAGASSSAYEAYEDARHVLTQLLHYSERDAEEMLRKGLTENPAPASADALIQAVFRQVKR